MRDGTGEKPAGAASWVENALTQTRVEDIDHKPGDGAGSVVLAGVASRLQVGEDFLVDVVEQVPVFRGIEIHVLFDGIDYLAQQGARLHVVVGVFKHRAYNSPTGRHSGSCRQSFEHGEEFIVDEFDQLFASDTFRVLGPVAPTEAALEWRLVAGDGQLPFLFFVVKNLQEQEPAHLADPLSVTIDADILAHDVLNGLDKGCRETWHFPS